MQKRWDIQTARRVLADQARSGLSKKAYCSERGINAATFYSWQRRLAEQVIEGSEGLFKEIKVLKRHELEVCLNAGNWLSLRSGSAATLAAVVKSLADA